MHQATTPTDEESPATATAAKSSSTDELQKQEETPKMKKRHTFFGLASPKLEDEVSPPPKHASDIQAEAGSGKSDSFVMLSFL